MFESLLNAFRAPDIRRRILFVLGILVVYRLLAQVPLPGVDRERWRVLPEQHRVRHARPVLGRRAVDASRSSALAMNPYINASIIMQLMTGVIPSLQALSREGEYGRQRLNQYTRYLTVPMALLQAFGILSAAQRPGRDHRRLRPRQAETLIQIVTLTAGAVPADVARRADHREGHRQRHQLHHLRRHRQPRPGGHRRRLPAGRRRGTSLFVVLAIVAVAVIIYIQEGQRRIPIQYASRVRGRRMYQGGQTFLPLRVNQAGVIPIIFAISILLFPGQLAAYFSTSEVEIVAQHREGDRRLPAARRSLSTRSSTSC